METWKRIFRTGLAAALTALLTAAAQAAAVSFDGAFEGISLTETLAPDAGRSLPSITPSAAGARAYDFQTLYRLLGYPSPKYFGSSEDEVSDLKTYTSKRNTYYKEINDYLRFHPEPYDWYGTSPEDAENIVKNLDRIFGRVPVLPGDLILFRGLDLKFRAGKSYEISEEFSDKGYASTSSSFKVARYFAIEINDNERTPSRKAIFALYFDQPGERGILIDAEEDEVILRRGLKFKVMAKKQDIKKYDLYLLQVCSEVCASSLREGVRDFWTNFNVRD